MNTPAVNPLERTCTEVFAEVGGEPNKRPSEPVQIEARELAEIPVFVLLGEPGMGKSETMKALAAVASDGKGQIVTVNDFIDFASSQCHAEHPVFIDALDEARAGGNTTVWSKLRGGIAQNYLTRFGIACRAADWYTTDADSLSAVANGQRVRVFALDPLNAEQRHVVLKHEGIPDIDGFEQKAEAHRFADMLGNPQSLKLLAAAIKGNGYQWPACRRDVYELACKELLRENNPHHLQALAREPTHSDEILLNTAGWLYALMLLSNRDTIADETQIRRDSTAVRLTEVLDALPANEPTVDATKQVLRRRLFIKPNNYTAIHRTVAEYLAARYIAQRISSGGLLASRVSALMLASSQHLVSNLRGLAGWLAVLSDPLRQIFFKVDPWAVLDYGDLHLLSITQRQLLIERLTLTPNPYGSQGRWQRAANHTPLVQHEMFDFVSKWLERYIHLSDAPPHVIQLADALLDALAESPNNPEWAPLLEKLVRDSSVSEDIRESALQALHHHVIDSEPLLKLLNALHANEVTDPLGRLTEYLLSHLYPTTVRPSEVMRYFKTTPQTGRFVSIQWFWGHEIAEITPNDQLLELMYSVSAYVDVGRFAEFEFRVSGEELKGLATLVVRAVEIFGTSAPTAKLAEWVRWCTDHEARFLHPIDQKNGASLQQWLRDHPDKVKEVLAFQIATGMKSWPAQYQIPSEAQPKDLGLFWLNQAKLWNQNENPAKACDCMETAIWWVFNHDGGGITLQDLEEAAADSGTLQRVLEPRLVSLLSDDNWRRKHWLSNERYRIAAAERLTLNKKNRRYLLDHLDEVRSGRLLSYLGGAAWHDMSDLGYSELGNSPLYAQWRDQHPELEEATQEGYVSLLYGLTAEDSERVIDAHKASGLLHLELPCLYAAHKLFSHNPHAIDGLGPERLQVLTTICLFSHGSAPPWFKHLVAQQPTWVEDIWWSICQSSLRSKTDIRIPQFGWLRREEGIKPVAQSLLPRLLTAWPGKFGETSFPFFAQLLEVCIWELPSGDLSNVIAKRLRRKSLGSLQTAYLLMAGLWVDHKAFAPQLQNLLTKKQIIQTELLGFVGHLRLYGRNSAQLPGWDAGTLALLFRLFGPLCSPDRSDGADWIEQVDEGRSFLHELLNVFGNDTTELAQIELQQLISHSSLQGWKNRLEVVASHQAQARAEVAFSMPTPRQVALTLQNKAPANPSDLMAVAWDALNALQLEVKNSPTDLIDRFWTYDNQHKHSIPPHQPEEQCRNVIADWLKPRLQNLQISVQIENQHGALKRSDLALLTQAPGQPEMLLPIEVKGDWHKDLRTAADEQLRQLYASEPRCQGHGLYLVLWTGEIQNLKKNPNKKANTAAELQQALQRAEDERDRANHIRVFVLDVSISA